MISMFLHDRKTPLELSIIYLTSLHDTLIVSKNPVQEKEFGKRPLIVSMNNNSINLIPYSLNYVL